MQKLKYLILHSLSFFQLQVMIKQEKALKLYLMGGEWNEEIRVKVMDITTWEVEYLVLGRNNRKSLLREIAHIRFTALKFLSVPHNQINSIEGLSSIYLPKIQQMILSHNNISFVRTIRKARWPSLKSLHLVNNYFCDAKDLNEGNFPLMAHLLLFYCDAGEEKNSFLAPSSPSKTQSQVVDWLHIRVSELSSNRSISSVYRKRWNQIQIQ